MTTKALRRIVIAAIALALAVYPLLRPDDRYRHTVLIMIFLLGIMAIGWNVIAGYTGYVSLGQSAFLGLGAYTVGILTRYVEVSPMVLAPLGGVVAAAVAVLLGLTIMRAREHAFVIMTIAFLFLMQTIALNFRGFTGGSNGITLPLPGWDADLGNIPFYYVFFGLLALSVLMAWWIRRTKLGMGLVSIREDEDKAAAIGVRTSVYKILAFVASAVLVGVAGGVYAYFLTFIDPRGMFDILISVQIVLACLLGGRGTLWGPVIGAFAIVPLNEYTVGIATGEGVRLFVFGLALMAVVLFLPRGVIPTVRAFLERRGRGVAPFERRPVHVSLPRVEGVGASDPPRPLLEIRDLSKRFGGLAAVEDCSFTVREGSLTALIGPNGSGKTTVFNLVTGMMRTDAGSIVLDGRRIERMLPWDRAYLGLGRTFQLTRLFPQLTVIENVVAPLRAFRWRELAADAVRGHEAERAEELLEFVGMAHFVGQPARQLSFGQQKLVELAQVLMLEPRLVLLDEPAGGVNPGLIERIAELIRTLNRNGITFLIVEHNMPFVLDLCDPILVMAQGKVIAEGGPTRIQNDPAVLDAYLGQEWGKATEQVQA
ncbi:MAG TPA: branched-chain amino acid ABC transporter ATP-binding protein/permease [Actinomycetota bacterium]|nr:branched-chain amino acid ABC transporter ATP-binding protein/permease [Actinomycetota bacterium]